MQNQMVMDGGVAEDSIGEEEDSDVFTEDERQRDHLGEVENVD